MLFFLLEVDALVDTKDINGCTALHKAAPRAFFGCFYSVQSLLAAGANVDEKNVQGLTPLLTAASVHYADSVIDISRS